MFYKGKATVIDSSNFVEYCNFIKKNKDTYFINKQLQKMVAGNNMEQYAEYVNLRGYDLILGNCRFLSSIFMKVLVERINKIYDRRDKDILTKIFNKYNSNIVEDGSKIKFQKKDFSNLESLREKTIYALILDQDFLNSMLIKLLINYFLNI